jgi:hypothetical protein
VLGPRRAPRRVGDSARALARAALEHRFGGAAELRWLDPVNRGVTLLVRTAEATDERSEESTADHTEIRGLDTA